MQRRQSTRKLSSEFSSRAEKFEEPWSPEDFIQKSRGYASASLAAERKYLVWKVFRSIFMSVVCAVSLSLLCKTVHFSTLSLSFLPCIEYFGLPLLVWAWSFLLIAFVVGMHLLCFLFVSPRSNIINAGTGYATMLWASACFMSFSVQLVDKCHGDSRALTFLPGQLLAFGIVLWIVSIPVSQHLVLLRVRMLYREMNFGSLMPKVLRNLLYLQVFLLMTSAVLIALFITTPSLFNCQDVLPGSSRCFLKPLGWFFWLVIACFVLCYLSFALCCFRAFSTPVFHLRRLRNYAKESKQDPDEAKESEQDPGEAKFNLLLDRATTALSKSRWQMIYVCLSSGWLFVSAWEYFMAFSYTRLATFGMFSSYCAMPVWFVEYLANIVMAADLVGLWHLIRVDAAEEYQTIKQQAKQFNQRGDFAGKWKEQRKDIELDPTKGKDWMDVVHKLEGFGVTVRLLLDLYAKLDDEFKASGKDGYTPCKHTTRDVVDRAILPMTMQVGVSYAEMKRDQGSADVGRPHIMVTHNWKNLYRNLVAAVLAFSLGEMDYLHIATLLDSDKDKSMLQRIKSMMTPAALDKRVWICALAVNQHACICGEHCKCNVLKLDNKHVKCEMNKFHHMMKNLVAYPDFSQLVAVDECCLLFTRVWCVSELVIGYKAGLDQRVVVTSRASLEKTLQAGNLDQYVTKMQATNAEDKEMVEEEIRKLYSLGSELSPLQQQNAWEPCDRDLHNLVVKKDGLLFDWCRLDGEAQMHRAGLLVRWHKALTKALIPESTDEDIISV